MGVGVGQVKPSNCFRCLEKLFLPSTFDTSLFHPWWCETCRVIQQQFWMKECNILGIKTYSDPSYIFSRGHNPNHQDLRPDQIGNGSSRGSVVKALDFRPETRSSSPTSSLTVTCLSIDGVRKGIRPKLVPCITKVPPYTCARVWVFVAT